MSDTKKVRYCEHVEKQEARPYMRLGGAEYDLIVCWRCQNDAVPFMNELSEIQERIKKLTNRK